jgi:hypothetical protein
VSDDQHLNSESLTHGLKFEDANRQLKKAIEKAAEERRKGQEESS